MNQKDRTTLLQMLAISSELSELSMKLNKFISQVIEQPDYINNIKSMTIDLVEKTNKFKTNIDNYNPTAGTEPMVQPVASEPTINNIDVSNVTPNPEYKSKDDIHDELLARRAILKEKKIARRNLKKPTVRKSPPPAPTQDNKFIETKDNENIQE